MVTTQRNTAHKGGNALPFVERRVDPSHSEAPRHTARQQQRRGKNQPKHRSVPKQNSLFSHNTTQSPNSERPCVSVLLLRALTGDAPCRPSGGSEECKRWRVCVCLRVWLGWEEPMGYLQSGAPRSCRPAALSSSQRHTRLWSRACVDKKRKGIWAFDSNRKKKNLCVSRLILDWGGGAGRCVGLQGESACSSPATAAAAAALRRILSLGVIARC